MSRPPMSETRRETIRQALDLTLKFPERYPTLLKDFPPYARKAVAEKLRKFRSFKRALLGFSKRFEKITRYSYNGEEEVEETKWQ
jgi:hypothetical protein